MKKILFVAAALVFSLAMKAQSTHFADVVKLNTETHNFGKIPQGKPVEFTFLLTNKSEKPVVIEYAQATCGCTTPDVPKEPIAPGATAKLRVTYNAAGTGVFTKPVHIKLVGVDEVKTVNLTGEQIPQG